MTGLTIARRSTKRWPSSTTTPKQNSNRSSTKNRSASFERSPGSRRIRPDGCGAPFRRWTTVAIRDRSSLSRKVNRSVASLSSPRFPSSTRPSKTVLRSALAIFTTSTKTISRRRRRSPASALFARATAVAARC